MSNLVQFTPMQLIMVKANKAAFSGERSKLSQSKSGNIMRKACYKAIRIFFSHIYSGLLSYWLDTTVTTIKIEKMLFALFVLFGLLHREHYLWTSYVSSRPLHSVKIYQNFLQLRFHVKSILGHLESEKQFFKPWISLLMNSLQLNPSKSQIVMCSVCILKLLKG